MQKDELLLALREGGFVTGEELGRRFGVSRAAVSKAMAALPDHLGPEPRLLPAGREREADRQRDPREPQRSSLAG